MQALMGIDSPAYTEYLGGQLLDAIALGIGG